MNWQRERIFCPTFNKHNYVGKMVHRNRRERITILLSIQLQSDVLRLL